MASSYVYRLYILGELKVFWLSLIPNNVRGEEGLFMECKYLYNIERQKQENLGKMGFLNMACNLACGLYLSVGEKKKYIF